MLAALLSPAFLRTAAGTATAFMVLNTVHGLDQTGDAAPLPVTPEQCDDPVAARTLFEAEYFVMDVQLHHVDLERFNVPALVPILARLRFLEGNLPDEERLQRLSQLNMVKEVFVDSETAVGVISGVPNGVPLPVQTMAETRDMVNNLAGSRRALSQAMCDPRNPPGSETAIDTLEHQVRDLGASALKCYTGNGSWWLDDEDVAYPMLEEAYRLGLRVINVHKGFPQLLGSMAETYVQSRDLPKVSRDWPRLKFVTSPSAIIDLIAIVPPMLAVAGGGTMALRFVRFFRILRLAKLGRFSRAWTDLADAIKARRDELFIAFSLAGFVMLIASTLLYWAEGDAQPDKFGSIPRAAWWAIVTLTTVGYGDVFPITPLGKFFSGLVLIAAIGLIALPTGIFAGAMTEVIQRKKPPEKD